MEIAMVNYTSLASELVNCLCITADAKHNRNTEDFIRGELRILAYLAGNGNGSSPGDIGESLNMTTPRMSAAVSTLTKKELVTRVTDERDKRRLHIYITEKGKSLVEEKKANLTESLADILRYLGEDDAKEYVRIMSRICESDLCEADSSR